MMSCAWTVSSGSTPIGWPFRHQRTRRYRADAAGGQARAERMEHPHQGEPLHHAHRAQIMKGHQGLGAVLRDDPSKARGDLVERLVPTDADKARLALDAIAAQGMQHPIRRGQALLVIAHLGAQHAAGDRMLLCALDAADAAVLDLDRPAAAILAVERAAAFDGDGHASCRFPELVPASRCSRQARRSSSRKSG